MFSPETIAKYAYLAVLAGTFAEGETVLVFGGLLAQERRVSFPGILAAAFAGAYSGHLFWFWAGRRHGPQLLERFPRLEKLTSRAAVILERRGALSIFITQYLYGLRTAAAIAFGLSGIGFTRFALIQIANCSVWAVLIGTIGYVFGHAAERMLGRAATVEKYTLAAAIGIAVAFSALRHFRANRSDRSGFM